MNAMITQFPLLISCDWLEKNLSSPNLRIFDCTVWLKPQHNKIYKIFSGKPDYDKEHIPNSDFLDVLELSDKNLHNNKANNKIRNRYNGESFIL